MGSNKIILYNEDIPFNECEKILLCEEEIAIDTETTGLDPLVDELCLIQIYSIQREQVYFFRFNKGQEYTNLVKLLQADHVKKYFHNAVFDMRFVERNLGVVMDNVCCTKIASKILYHEKIQFTLKFLVEEFKHITLDKSMRTSNWNSFDLTEEQITYALSDVIYLKDLWLAMQSKLEDNNQLQYVQECFKFLPTQVYLMNHITKNIFEY